MAVRTPIRGPAVITLEITLEDSRPGALLEQPPQPPGDNRSATGLHITLKTSRLSRSYHLIILRVFLDRVHAEHYATCGRSPTML